jgi:hypothetical protein
VSQLRKRDELLPEVGNDNNIAGKGIRFAMQNVS